jgi:hypothetical protein
MHEVAHLMIDPETHAALLDMTAEELGGLQQIEDDAPASDLGVVITPRMVLPAVSVAVCARGVREATHEYFRTVHRVSIGAMEGKVD